MFQSEESSWIELRMETTFGEIEELTSTMRASPKRAKNRQGPKQRGALLKEFRVLIEGSELIAREAPIPNCSAPR